MPYEVEERDLPEVPVAAIVIPGIQASAVGAALGGALPDVFSHLSQQGVPMVGPPFARYHAVSGDSLDLEAGIPVGGEFTETERIKRRSLPGGSAIATWHVGPYEGLPEAVAALAAWREANGRVAGGAHWEVYWSDPGEVPPDQLRTEVVEPLAPVDPAAGR